MTFDTNQSSYRDFRDTISQRSDAVVAWVGAGLSAAAGLPGWEALKAQLSEELNRKVNSAFDEVAQTKLRSQYNAAKEASSYWDAFSTLKDALGGETYRSVVRKALKPATTAKIPDAYRHLWQLGIAGILNLNLDRLATRAHSSVFNGSSVLHEFQSWSAGDRLHVLKGGQAFVANLHGIDEEQSSWVFTKQELKSLLRKPGYQTLISACVTTRTILFVGISADDIAAGGHLAKLASKGISAGPHYWLTHRTDLETDRWAENAGIRVIRYQNSDGSHRELQEFLDDLKAYVPQEDEVHPVVPSIDAVPLPPSSEDLEKLGAEEIRQELNCQAVAILGSNSLNRIEEYEQFCEVNGEAIHRAWFTDTKPPKNEILGYRLLERVAFGAFGTVYRAETPGGTPCAVKILHQQIHSNHDRLQSFRRGVASMAILTARNVNGIVPYRQAFEIPAFVVMDFVDGVNLDEAVRKGIFRNDWRLVLRVATSLASILRASHRLPERVMHRDVRPANVMLKNCWAPRPALEDVEVVVLDFDLSWHVNAYDVSITDASSVTGYLAPEQVERKQNVSTRNTAVDSFGVGMTLYFIRTGIEPLFSEHRHQNWQATLNTAAINAPCEEWVSLPTRFFRLIGRATADDQAMRSDMATVEGELQQLREAIHSPNDVRSTELLAEELASRVFKNEYSWSMQSLSAAYDTAGTAVTIAADETNARVRIKFRWDHRNLTKYAPRIGQILESHLLRRGFTADSNQKSSTALLASVSIPTEQLRQNLRECVRGVTMALEAAQSTS